MSDKDSELLIKPLLRGHFHQEAFFVALGACAMLVAKSGGARSMVASLIYSVCLLNLFGTSALYHRPNWEPRKRGWLRRLDHSAIFLLIAGTVSPICLIGLPGATGAKLLILVWGASLVGIFQAVFWFKASKWLTATLAIVVGWSATPFLPEIRSNLGWSNLLLLLAGGVLYTAGAVIYALKRPDPSPRYFGYHEIFHILVVIAAFLHFVVVARIVS